MSKKTFVLVGILLGILLVGGVVWYGKSEKDIPVPKDNSKAVTEDKKKGEEGKKEESVQLEYDLSGDLDVSKWAIYESEKVGVRIRYPENWKIIEFADERAGFALRSPAYIPIQGMVVSTGEIYVDSISNPKQLSIKNLFQTFDDVSKFWFSQYEYETIKIGNRGGIHFPEISERIYFEENYNITGNKRVYSFAYSYQTNNKNPLVSEILRKIVENFEPLE